MVNKKLELRKFYIYVNKRYTESKATIIRAGKLEHVRLWTQAGRKYI